MGSQEKLQSALCYLKANNPFYEDIIVETNSTDIALRMLDSDQEIAINIENETSDKIIEEPEMEDNSKNKVHLNLF